MASIGSILSKHPVDDAILPQRKRLKASDLPLTSAQRSSIDNLLHTIKKKGAFDALRKKVWSQFDESVGFPGYNHIRIYGILLNFEIL